MDCIKLSLWRSDVKNIIFKNSIVCGVAFAFGEYVSQTLIINKAKWHYKIKCSHDIISIFGYLIFGFGISYLTCNALWGQIESLSNSKECAVLSNDNLFTK